MGDGIDNTGETDVTAQLQEMVDTYGVLGVPPVAETPTIYVSLTPVWGNKPQRSDVTVTPAVTP